MTKGGSGGTWIAGLVALVAVFIILALVVGNLGGEPPDLAGPTIDEDEDRSSGATDEEDQAPGEQEGDDGNPFFGGGGGLPGGGGARFRPDSLAVDETSVWVSDINCGVVVQIDKETEEVVGSLDVAGAAAGVTIADGSVWVATRNEGRLVRIDPVTFSVEGLVTVPGFALGLSTNGSEVWSTDPTDEVVHRVDASSGTLIGTIDVGSQAHHIAVAEAEAWITNTGEDTVTRFESASGQAADINVGVGPLHVEVGEGSAWVTNSRDGTVTRLANGSGAEEAVIDVGPIPHALAVTAGSVWVGTETGQLWQIDPATNTATLVEGVSFNWIDSAVDGTDVWVADSSGGTVIKFDAAAVQTAAVVDLAEFGDCDTFRDNAVSPPLVGDISVATE